MSDEFLSSEDLIRELEDLISNLKLSGSIERGNPSAYQKTLIDYSYDIVVRLQTGDNPRSLPSAE